MVLHFPPRRAARCAAAPAVPAAATAPAPCAAPAQCTDRLPQRADLQALLQQLHAVGEGGHSAELQAALRRLGCASEHAALVMLVQTLLATQQGWAETA